MFQKTEIIIFKSGKKLLDFNMKIKLNEKRLFQQDLRVKSDSHKTRQSKCHTLQSKRFCQSKYS